MKSTASKKRSMFFRIALIAMVLYAIVSLIQVKLQLDEQIRELTHLTNLTADQNRLNEDLQNQVENSEAYLEEGAREQGMVKPGETVLIEIPGE